ncbi:hypothetical protein [Rhizobium phaseoli]|uniref:hypothetical protein n=1 Tax=Rhizobium phaseoli TaxID=396 RepID=UPI00168014E6|nr:hypothetical protein [Rhizobium phaseoli]
MAKRSASDFFIICSLYVPMPEVNPATPASALFPAQQPISQGVRWVYANFLEIDLGDLL